MMILSEQLYAQKTSQQLIDSLLPLVNNKEDSNQIKVLCLLSRRYSSIDFNKGIYYGNLALKISKKIKWTFGEAKSYSALAKNYWSNSDYMQSIDNGQKAATLIEKENNSTELLLAYNTIANTIFAQKNYDLALSYYYKSLRLFENTNREKIPNYPIGNILNNIGMTYQAKGQLDEALKYYEKTIALKNTDSIQIAKALIYEGTAFTELKKIELALEKLNQSYQLSMRLNDLSVAAECLRYISLTYEENKQFDSAINALKKNLVINTKLRDPNEMAKAKCKIGHLIIEKLKYNQTHLTKKNNNAKGQITEALLNINEGIKLSAFTSDLYAKSEYQKTLSEAYEFSGDYKKSLEAYKKSTANKDSLNNKEKDREFYKKMLEFDYNRKKDSIAFGNQIQKEKIKSLQQQNKLKDFKLKQQLLFGLFIFLLLLSVTVIISNRYKIKSITLKKKLETEKNERLIQESNYNIDLNNLRLAALRTQMNPHFIFNCLNSIKLFAEENDTASASAFLTSFSKLIRKMLDSTKSEKIILADEIEMIQLYLHMEKMRLKEKLNFVVSVNDDVDIDFVEIPTLLIQPYVENAIWHGLMPKENGGNIAINIKNQETDNLIISIIDDGIGRTNSAQLKTDKSHTSHGTKLTNERIRIFNEKYKTHCKIVTSDIYDHHSEIAGTKVEIIIPYLNKESNS